MAVMRKNPQTQAVRDRADEAAKKAIESMTPGALFAFQLAARNIKDGVFWGFTDMASVQKHAEAIKADQNIVARKVGTKDCIIEVNPQYMLSHLLSIAPDAFSKKDIQHIQDNMGSAVVEFQKFLINKGINTPGYGSTIGIYCTNNVTSIAYKGVSYPAFRVNMDMAMNVFARLGYSVKVKGSFIPAAQAMGAGADLWASTQLSPTKTGVFLNIKATYKPEQLKQIKAEMDKRYGAGNGKSARK